MNKNLYMKKIGEKAKTASLNLSNLSINKKNSVLRQFSQYLKKNEKLILNANKKDISNAKSKNIKNSMIDRLKLDSKKIKQIRNSIKKIIIFKDPVGKTLSSWKRPNGLIIKRVSIPIGVIGVIYESRPNVTSDVSALCFKSGNVVILRGGSEAFHSNKILAKLFKKALKKKKCDENCIQFVESRDRTHVDYLLAGMKNYIDLIIPRGGKGLIQSMVENATVPYILDGDGNVHLYIHEDADADKVNKIVINAKVQRPGVCNALETLIIHNKYIEQNGSKIIDELLANGVEIFIDEVLSLEYPNCKVATEDEYYMEFHDYKIAIKIVENLDEAIEHINIYSSGHTESILTKDEYAAEKFSNSIDSSVIFINASTRFTDGEIFGFGAEIGISTQKLHVRGPMGLEALTSERYIVKGHGQIRE